MNHERVSQLLDAYVDGDLDAQQITAIEAHLESCAVCSDEVAQLRALAVDVAQLPRSIEPSSDLWPAIDSRISAPPAKRPLAERTLRSLRLPLAAAAVVLIAASSLVTALIMGSRESLRTDPAPVVVAPEGSTAEGVSFIAQWQRSEGEYLRATLQLAESLELAKQQLAPETVGIIERNLQIIDSAIQESRAALALDPTNRELMLSLSSAYQRKLAVLQHVNGVVAQL